MIDLTWMCAREKGKHGRFGDLLVRMASKDMDRKKTELRVFTNEAGCEMDRK